MPSRLFHQLAIANAVRLHIAHACTLVLLIFRVSSLEVEHLAVALECENVSADAVEEPAVVRNNYGAAGEVLQSLFESTQSVHVDVVGRLVEQQHVTFLLQCHGKVQAVALTTRKHGNLLLLVGTGEIKL